MAMNCCDKAKKLGTAIVHEAAARMQGRRLPAEQRIARMKICEGCPERSDMWCGKCGCYLPAKARFVSEECPLGKWEDLNRGQGTGVNGQALTPVP